MKGMIVAAQPESAEVGALVLRRGGNAIDAAVACAFTQCVVDPQMAGIAGYGAMQVFMPGKGVHETIEFYGRSRLPHARTCGQIFSLPSRGMGLVSFLKITSVKSAISRSARR